MEKENLEVTTVKNGDIYCVKCKRFLGAICDPFAESYCEDCFPTNKQNK